MPEHSLLSQAGAAFGRAVVASSTTVRHYRVADRLVRLRFAGDALAAVIDPALSHLACAEVEPDWSADVFVSSAPPVSLSPAEWVAAATYAKRQPPGGLFVHYDSGAGRLTLVQGRSGLVCLKRAEYVSPWDLASPLRECFAAWAASAGAALVHGGAVADAGTAVLLAGAGGSGKSNSALSCLMDEGLSYLADDVCLLQRSAAGYIVHGLYNSAKLLPQDLGLFPHLRLGDTGGPGKRTFFLSPDHADRLGRGAPLAAVLLPRIAGGETHLAPAAPADAWHALLPSTLKLLPGHHPTVTAWLGELVRRVPAYWLRLGPAREQTPAVIRRFLQRHARAA